MQKKIAILLILINSVANYLIFYSYGARHWFNLYYPMAEVIAPAYGANVLFALLIAGCISLPLLIFTYIVKNQRVANMITFFSSFIIVISIGFSADMLLSYKNAETNFNPETVQSTMVEVNLQQLKALRDNEETTMIYVGRPNCPNCKKIKPNLDILVNNSHSKLYYYNTEQDRDDNHDEMQAVLDTYGVAAVPALVVWAGAGETQEVYFNEDIIDYFLDTNRFSY